MDSKRSISSIFTIITGLGVAFLTWSFWNLYGNLAFVIVFGFTMISFALDIIALKAKVRALEGK